MSKRTIFTTITPLPPNLTRQAVISFLQDHEGIIRLNPLVKDCSRIRPPLDADPEEARCIWYSITDEISYIPGGIASGNISYTCVFNNLPTGIQTHCRAPMGVDIQEKWTVNGSLPGEPLEPVELGLNAPQTGLYIREDVDLKCNVLMAGFVKKNLKKSHGTLVARLATKAQKAARSDSKQSFNPPSAGLSPLTSPIDQRSNRSGSYTSISTHSTQSQRVASPPAYQPYQHSRTYSTSTGDGGHAGYGGPLGIHVQQAPGPCGQPRKISPQPCQQPASNGSATSPYPDPLRISRPSSTTSSASSARDGTGRPTSLRPSHPSIGVTSQHLRSSSAPAVNNSYLQQDHPDYPIMNPYADGNDSSPILERTKQQSAPVFAELVGSEVGQQNAKVSRPPAQHSGMSGTLSGPFLAELE